MKVCPTCQSRFVGGETFCPHDGTKLVDARDLSPGELTGSKLGEAVRLDRLMFSDGLGERYAGRMLESRRLVFVTVFNQSAAISSDAQRRVETLRAQVGAPLPEQINTLLELHLGEHPAYVIESEPRGPSIRSILDEQHQIDWKSAVRVGANLARVAQWLVDEGASAPVFHPWSVYVTRLAEGSVQVSDWYLGSLLEGSSPRAVLEGDATAFVGYVDYMAPELAADSSAADVRSSMYSIGCLIYEMILGKPPLPARGPLEVIKRHKHEKPVRLGIARGGGEFPEELDDLVEMLLAKDPGSRFQSANAVCAALANLLDVAPTKLAPQIARTDEVDEDDLYRTIDMDSVDRSELVAPSSKPSTDAPDDEASQAGDGSPLSGESETRDDSTTSTDRRTDAQTGQFGKPAAAAAEDDAEEEEPDVRRRTLLFGQIGPAVSRAADAADEEAARPTMMLGSGALDAIAAGPTEDEDPDDTSSNPTLLSFGEAPNSGILKQKTIGKASPNGEARDNPDQAQALSRSDVSAEIEAATSEAEEADEKPTVPIQQSDIPKKKQKRGRKQRGGAQATAKAAETEKSPETPERDPSLAKTLPAGSIQAQDIGSIPAKDASVELEKSSWFMQSTEDAWDASLVQEEHRRVEKTNRAIVVGIVLALAAAAAGLYVYSEYLYAPEGAEVAETEEEKTPAVAEPAVNLDELATAFDEALTSNRLISPLGNSALHYLQQLKRHGSESPQYEGSREKFVATAREAAKKADEAGDLASARSLAGYASQFAPADEELARMTAELQARFTGETPEIAAPAADAGAPDAGEPDAGTPAVEEPPPAKPEPPAVVQKKPQKKAQKKAQKREPRKKQQPKKSSASADDLAQQARVAFSRGDMNEATKLYHEALDQDSKNGDVYAGLGKVYFERAKYREAVKYQQLAVRYSPGRMDYRVSLGQSFYRLGKYQEAINVWEGVLTKDPNNRFARQYIELAKKKL